MDHVQGEGWCALFDIQERINESWLKEWREENEIQDLMVCAIHEMENA